MALPTGGEGRTLPLASVRVVLDPAHSETFVLEQGCDSETYTGEHCIWVANLGKLFVLDLYLSNCNVFHLLLSGWGDSLRYSEKTAVPQH